MVCNHQNLRLMDFERAQLLPTSSPPFAAWAPASSGPPTSAPPPTSPHDTDFGRHWPLLMMSKRGRDFWELFLGYVILDICYGHVLCVCVIWVVYLCCIWILVCFLYGHVDMCYVFRFEVSMNLLSYMDTFLLLWYGSYFCYEPPSGIYINGWLSIAYGYIFVPTFYHSLMEDGGIYGWMEVTIYAYMFIFLYLWYS